MIKFHFTKIVLFMFTTAIIAGNSNHGTVNILPTPKKMEIGDKRFVLDAQNSVIMIDKNAGKESFLGAEEINKKIKELNGNALPVKRESELSSAELKEKNLIILGMVNSDLIIPFKKYFNVADIKPEGYIVKHIIEDSRNIYIIASNDFRGLLYGCVTFKHLIFNQDDKIYAMSANVTDWPDCKYRAQYLGSKQTTNLIDWCSDHKINQIHISPMGRELFILPTDPKTINYLKEVNNYAHERGIETICNCIWCGVGAISEDKDKEEFKNWECQKHHNKFMCWSADELIEKKAKEISLYLKETGFDGILFHFRDGRPDELYRSHCPTCEKRFGNNRAAADANYINITYNVLKKAIPSLKIIFVTEPYYGNLDIPQNAKYKDFYRELGKLIPQDVYLVNASWDRESQLSWKKNIRQPILQWRNLPMNPTHIGRYFSSNIGFAVKAGYFPESEDIALPASHVGFNPAEALALASVEFMWNIDAPGNMVLHSDTKEKPYKYVEDLYAYPITVDGMDYTKWLWYESVKGPKEIIDELLPRLCDEAYGKEASAMMVEILKFGVANKSLVNTAFKNFFNDPEILKDQHIKAQKAYEMLTDFKKKGGTFKNNPMGFSWLDNFTSIMKDSAIAAKSDYHILLAEKYLNENRFPEAEGNIKEAMRNLEENNCVKKYGNITQKINDVSAAMKLRNSHVKKDSGSIKVAIYNPNSSDGLVNGENILFAILQQQKDIVPVFISSLNKIFDYDCLILPSCKQFSKEDSASFFDIEKEVFNAEQIIRDYVINKGGGVLFYHDSVGAPRFAAGKPIFPELCSEAKQIDRNKIRILSGHCLTENIKSGTAAELMSNDYISMIKAEKGTVIAEDMDSNPVVIAGELGKGKIVLTGFFIPEKNKNGDILKNDSIEKKMLLNSIYWLSGRKIH